MKNKVSLLLILAVTVSLIFAGLPGTAARAATTTVQSVGVTSTPPTAIDNDFTRIDNAIHSAVDGDVIKLVGTFDFSEPFAQAAWALGHDGITGTNDDYEVDVPANLDGITLTADYLGAATIQGPGDVPTIDLEGFLQFYNSGTNQNWTISNLRILDFDLGIGLFCCNSSPGTAFNGFTITKNYIRVATDLKGGPLSSDPESLQNIGIHLAYGNNETISYNTIDLPGNGVSDAAATPVNYWLYSATVGLQSNTHGGTSYDGLLIDHNVVRVLHTQNSPAERIRGIWENGHAHLSDITVSNNQFINLGAGNDPSLNNQQAFRVTSHSSATTTVNYTGNSASGANVGFYWLSATTTHPVIFSHNTVSDAMIGMRLETGGKATFNHNVITNSGAMSGLGTGIYIPATAAATIGTSAGSTRISGFATGVDVNGGSATINYSELSGNGVGLLVQSTGTATAHYSNISGNTTYGVNNTSGVVVDATYNYWGSVNGACKPADQPACTSLGDKISIDVNAEPYGLALIDSVTASTHEIGETGTLDTNITANGVYGMQFQVNHDAGVVSFLSGVHTDVGSWFWDLVLENFAAVAGGTRLSGSMQGPVHVTGADLSGQSVATWTYTCNSVGASALVYDTTPGTGTYLSDVNGFEIPAAMVGDSITCVLATSQVDGYVGLQGRLKGAADPRGWYNAVVTMTCTAGACLGEAPYTLVTDLNGYYLQDKSTAGSGVANGTYAVTITRRGYLPATKTGIVISGDTTLTPAGSPQIPTLSGGDINGDSSVGVTDLTSVGGSFGAAITPDTGPDINGDGYVNVFDLVMVGGNFDKTASVWP
jgi:hypothetical protein